MPESIPSTRRPCRAVLVWAICATLAAFVLGNTTLILLVKLYGANARLAAAATLERNRVASRRSTAPAAGGFAALQDSDVAGRYHLFQEGTNVGIITLLPNHSIINKDGTTFPQYHWEIQPMGLMTMWQRGQIFFDVMEKPGVYVSRFKNNNDYRRLEKVEE